MNNRVNSYSEERKIIDEIQEKLHPIRYNDTRVFTGKDFPQVDYILNDLTVELDKIKGGKWKGIEILNVIKDYLSKNDGSKVVLARALDVLAHYKLQSSGDDYPKIIKPLIDNISAIDKNKKDTVTNTKDREIIVQIVQTISTITGNNEITQDIEKNLH